jgi:hypothetical protein
MRFSFLIVFLTLSISLAQSPEPSAIKTPWVDTTDYASNGIHNKQAADNKNKIAFQCNPISQKQTTPV